MMFPAYLGVPREELLRRAEAAVASLARCRVCPRDCDVDRLRDETAICRAGRRARVSSWFPHFGEEDCLRGWNGSGTIFFGWCNLRCVFCQNWETSQEGAGEEVDATKLAGIMIDLQNRGCHNVNFVTPEHVVPQILEALPIAIDAGLRLPLVYNTSAYDSLESLHWMDGLVDIYMPDFKYWDPHRAARLLKAKDYPSVARAAITEMNRQVGTLQVDENGIAKRGVLVRHLVMPEATEDAAAIFGWLANSVDRNTYVNVMDQYHPDGSVLRAPEKYPELARASSAKEHAAALYLARKAGLRVDMRRPHPRLGRRLRLID